MGNNKVEDGPVLKGYSNPNYDAKGEQNGVVAIGERPENENEESKEKEKDGKTDEEELGPQVSAIAVFRFADWKDKLFMGLGCLFACAHGMSLPLLMLCFGEMTDSFIDFASMNSQVLLETANFTAIGYTKEQLANDCNLLKSVALEHYNVTITKCLQDTFIVTIRKFAIYYIILGCGVMLFAFGQVTFWLLASFRQAHKIRLCLYAAIMRQEIGWFDTHESGELNTRLASDVMKIQEGLGDKISNFLQWFCSFLAGITIGFVYGWKLTLLILAVGPLLAITGGLVMKLVTDLSTQSLKAYARAGAVAEEVISSIRTVVAFGGQEKEVIRYKSHLGEAKASGVRQGHVFGLGMGITYLIMFLTYALTFWYGSKLVREEEAYTAGKMLVILFSVLIGAFALGNAMPNLQNFSIARAAAYSIWGIIDNVPSIDSFSPEGLKPSSLKGQIEFHDVDFEYPSRKGVQVLTKFNLKVEPGQTVALVGSSGCGKSTTVALLQRFFDPQAGKVTIDGNDIKELNVKWLRDHIGIVSQEPVLFATTIAENIRYGRRDVTQKEIVRACKEANAYDFIQLLPKKFQTLVGERGAQLSGGQKQRVAIARALVRNPRILLLDEATSALDTESEATVQAALDKARLGRTTIVIAHRLSTVKTADRIAGIMSGQVVEIGSHSELMEKGGVYEALYTHQTQHLDDDDEELFEEVVLSGPDGKISTVSLLRQSSIRLATRKSVMSVSKEKAALKEEEENLPDPDMKRLFRLNAPEWYLMVFGCLGALLSGTNMPAFAIMFAEILGVFVEPDLAKKKKVPTATLR